MYKTLTVLASVLALTVILALTGCAGSPDGTTDTPELDEINRDSSAELTLDTVIELAEKGEELSWSDFEQYPHEDIGSGLMIFHYDVDEDYFLLIGGVGSGYPPMYIYLVSKADESIFIDIRTEDVTEFINRSNE